MAEGSEALGPTAVALMSVAPLPAPLAHPVDDTEATVGSALLQENAMPGTTTPDAVRASARSCIESPVSRVTPDELETTTAATIGGGGGADASEPPHDANTGKLTRSAA
jgi:hypothetical protein